MGVRIHPTAEVSEKAKIGEGTSIWNQSQVRENAVIGKNCIISKNVYIDCGVTIGSNVKIQNNVSVYHGVTVEDGAFIGPHVCFTNDLLPRSITEAGELKGTDDWTLSKTLVKQGASIGTNSTIICGITLGRFSLIGAGSVVTKDIPDHGLAYGNPAKLRGYVCFCGQKLENINSKYVCSKCNKEFSF